MNRASFLQCPLAWTIWYSSPLTFMLDNRNSSSFILWWVIEKKQEGLNDLEQVRYISFILWQIWRARNDKIYRNINLVGEKMNMKI